MVKFRVKRCYTCVLNALECLQPFATTCTMLGRITLPFTM